MTVANSTRSPGDGRLHVVLDRDGVLNREVEGRTVRSSADWEWEQGAADGLALLAELGADVSIVTNQSAVSRGLLRADELRSLHEWLDVQLRSMGVNLLGIHACEHEDGQGCTCRKPLPGMVLAALRSSAVPPTRTVLIGDDARDLDAARAAGIRPLLVRTGKGRTVEATAADVATFDDLRSAVASLPATLPPRAAAPNVRSIFAEHLSVIASAVDVLSDDLASTALRLRAVLDSGGTVFAAGNGGSAADAQHFVAELVGRFGKDRAPMRAIALGTDDVTASALANDFGFDAALDRQLAALARPGDVLVAISTSGMSANVCSAARNARDLGCSTIALTGAGGGQLAGIADFALRAPSDSTARIQEVHSLCLHVLAELLDTRG